MRLHNTGSPDKPKTIGENTEFRTPHRAVQRAVAAIWLVFRQAIHYIFNIGGDES